MNDGWIVVVWCSSCYGVNGNGCFDGSVEYISTPGGVRPKAMPETTASEDEAMVFVTMDEAYEVMKRWLVVGDIHEAMVRRRFVSVEED